MGSVRYNDTFSVIAGLAYYLNQVNHMASLKKEVAALLSRFDAAQEAFIANTADTKKLQKQHKKALKQGKKDLKSANKTIAKLEEQVADLKKELQDAKQELTLSKAKVMDSTAKTKSSAPAKGKRGPGRPRKAATEKSSSTKTTAKGATVTKKGTNQVPVAPATPSAAEKKTTKRRSNAAAKKTSFAASGTPAKKRGPGRPRKNPPAPESPLRAVAGIGPAMARAFEAAGVTTPSELAASSDDKMREVLNGIGRRYNNPSDQMIADFRQAAKEAS